MHEMHLVKDLFQDVLKYAREHQARAVTKIYIRMGAFTEINEDILRHFFREQGRGTILEGAEFLIEKKEGRELRLLSFDCD